MQVCFLLHWLKIRLDQLKMQNWGKLSSLFCESQTHDEMLKQHLYSIRIK